MYLCENRHMIVRLIENQMSWALTFLGCFTSCTGPQEPGGRGMIAPLTLFIATGGQIMPTTLPLTSSRFSDLPTALQEVQEKAIQLSKKISQQRCYIRAECSLLKQRKGKKSAISPRALHERTLKVPILGHNIHCSIH